MRLSRPRRPLYDGELFGQDILHCYPLRWVQRSSTTGWPISENIDGPKSISGVAISGCRADVSLWHLLNIIRGFDVGVEVTDVFCQGKSMPTSAHVPLTNCSDLHFLALFLKGPEGVPVGFIVPLRSFDHDVGILCIDLLFINVSDQNVDFWNIDFEVL